MTTPLRPLFIIPARGGSKGIPHKNIRHLHGRPLIAWTIDTARALTDDLSRVILSTDDAAIARVATEECGLPVSYMRPASLATDTSGTREVIIDAMDYADRSGITYDCVVLLQPTSPLRTPDDVIRCMETYADRADCDMVVSVCEAASNPYYNCFETDPATGALRISKGDGLLTRRQDAPPAWEYTGAVYVIRPGSIRTMEFGRMPLRIPCVTDRARAIDLDTPRDWAVAEVIMDELDPKPRC